MAPIEISPGDALKLWHQIAVRQVLDESPDLNVRQIAILLTIYLEPPPHTVRDLARKLNVTKPVITRALDTMSHMKLLERRPDERDRRSIVVRRTVEGTLYLEKLGDLISQTAKGQSGHG